MSKLVWQNILELIFGAVGVAALFFISVALIESVAKGV